MSKGCWRRPCRVSHKKYSDNWDRIFNQKKKAKKIEEKEDEKQDTNVRADNSTDE